MPSAWSARTKRVHRCADIIRAESFHQKIGGQIAADGHHQLAKLVQRARLPDSLVQIGFGIVSGIEPVARSVDQTVKLVLDRQRFVELELALAHLMKQLDHHGNFHGAGGVKDVVGAREPFDLAVQGAKGNANVRAALLNAT